jgi:hypothetical protein
VKRLTAWLTGVAGGMAAYRAFKRAPQPAVSVPDPAVALREKLAETKGAEPPAPQPADPDAPDDRRKAVHERGRAVIDEMQGSDRE